MTIGLNRRKVITGLCSAVTAWPLAANTQQRDPARRMGMLMGVSENDRFHQARVGALEQGLKELGWEIGRNLRVDLRWAGGDKGRVRAYAAELVSLNPDIIVAHGPATLTALRDQARSIPIVFLAVADPVRAGFVASLAAPGANITGFTNYEFTTGGKWLELLREVTPRVSRVMVLLNPANPTAPGYVRTIEAVAASSATQVVATPVPDSVDYEDVIASFARERNGGMILLPDIKALVHRERIVALAARYRLPGIYFERIFAEAGGLVSYAPDFLHQWRQAATYVDIILKGENPATLPIKGATKFELVINLKSAKVLGIEVPPTLLARADEVIE
jgi:putative tryptophan/tyrosine transport system substrate-binding protein